MNEKQSKAMARLLNAACLLNEIVEGTRSVCWQINWGGRLKDTPEWCEFYVALQQAKDSAQEK